MKLLTILLIGTLLLCSSGIVSAANETELTLFDDDDMTAAQKTITDSGIGYVFALMTTVSQYLIIVVPIVLVIMAMLYRMMNNAEKYKGAIATLLTIVGLLLALQLYYSIVCGMTPDISSVKI